MTHCNSCGFDSEDGVFCSHCHLPLSGPGAIVQARAQAGARKQRMTNIAAAMLCVLALLITLVFRAHGLDAKAATIASNGPPTHIVAPASKLAAGVIPGSPLSGNDDGDSNSPPVTLDPTVTNDSTDPNTVIPRTTDTTTTPPPAPTPPQGMGAVQVASTNLAVEDNSDNGRETTAGTVTILNTGAFPITDFRITLAVNGVDYALTPFEGAPGQAIPLMERTIQPGDQFEVPVYMNSSYPFNSVFMVKSVTVQATVDGPPGTVSDTIGVP